MTPSEPTPATPPVASITQSDWEAPFGRPEGSWRLRLYTIIFESGTRAGLLFDLLLILLVLASVVVVILDSVQSMDRYEALFSVLEWGFTLLFTVEYALRLACVRRPWRYATSFYGIVDLLAVLPTYLVFFVPEVNALINVRLLRLLRVFRLLKLGEYVSEVAFLGEALRSSRRKIAVFLSFVLITVAVLGTLMYVVEGPENGFTSIPVATLWGITTMTHRRLRRYHAEDRFGPLHRLVHDAVGVGHPGRPHWYRHGRDDRPPHSAARGHARVPRLPDRRPRR